ncbi:hypothetical protein [Streptomyces sp. HPF1205]|uniref:hypothetical protein n=1 Tax=Streptomyces sp. HPF1205 TaxID=2873262 RepID=UPI001CECD78B|nr:hypothetical protein [Streptomyces sp. HPF1205]
MALSRMRKAAAAGAAVAAIGGLSFGAHAFAAGPASGAGAATGTTPGSAVVRHTAVPAPAVRHTTPAVVTQPIAHGRVDGLAWSVTLEYHRTLPKGYEPPSSPGQAKAPRPTSLLCQRMSVGGVLIDHQGGPWADCEGLVGAHDPAGNGGEGLWGLHEKGTSGTRLFVARPDADVAYGVLTLSDGTRLTGRTVTVPHTGYRAWAVAIPSGRTIATVDQYDTSHHRVSHETEWR